MIKTNFTRMQVLELMEYLDNRKDDEIFDTYQEELDYYVAEKQVNNINYTHCCKTLKDKETPTLKDAFIAGYKKRALMSGLKYDEVSELSAITNFKCWKSFDLKL